MRAVVQGLERVVRSSGVSCPVPARRKLLELVALLQDSPYRLHLLKAIVCELYARSNMIGRLWD